MIILKLNDELKVTKNNLKKTKRRKAKENVLNFSRSGVVIDNKPHFVISVSGEILEDEEFLRMLDGYKGNIIASKSLEQNKSLKDILFDTKPYIKKAIFENFYIFLKNSNFKTKNLLIKDSDFLFYDKISELFPYVKTVSVITDNETKKEAVSEECFYEYGIKPVFLTEYDVCSEKYDIFADFENVEDNKLKLRLLNEEKYLYPNFKYLEIPEELDILKSFDLTNTTICAAFKKNY